MSKLKELCDLYFNLFSNKNLDKLTSFLNSNNFDISYIEDNDPNYNEVNIFFKKKELIKNEKNIIYRYRWNTFKT